jgi:hypothetical protein
MAWPKVLTGTKNDEGKGKPDPNPEVKPGEGDTPPEKSVADLIAEAVGPLKDHIGKLEADLAEAKKPKPSGAAPDPVSVLDDENAAFNQRLTPILAKQLEIEARIARDDVEKEYRKQGFGDLWDKNRTEIEKILMNTELVRLDPSTQRPVPFRGDYDHIRDVADMVIGRTARKEGIRYDAKENKFFLEDATSGEANFLGKKDVSKGLTKKQLEAAKRFGIPIEKYKDSVDRLDFVS